MPKAETGEREILTEGTLEITVQLEDQEVREDMDTIRLAREINISTERPAEAEAAQEDISRTTSLQQICNV